MIAVTGATGHVGGNLVRELLVRGEGVRALVMPRDGARALDGLEIERIPGDVAEPSSLVRAFEGVDVVYHLAGHISITPGEERVLQAVNVDGVRNVVDACIDRRVKRLVHLSSVHALAPESKGRPIDERQPFCDDSPVPPYNKSKAAGERVVLDGVRRGLDTVIVNPTGIIGPVDFGPSRMGRFILDLCARRLPGTVRGGQNWVDVRDVVKVAIAAADRGRTGERYIAGGHFASLQDLALMAEQAFGSPPPRLDAPIRLARLAAPLVQRWAKARNTEAVFTSFSLYAIDHYQKVSWAKAAREFGYCARPLRETVAAAIEWFRGAGLLPDRAAGS